MKLCNRNFVPELDIAMWTNKVDLGGSMILVNPEKDIVYVLEGKTFLFTFDSAVRELSKVGLRLPTTTEFLEAFHENGISHLSKVGTYDMEKNRLNNDLSLDHNVGQCLYDSFHSIEIEDKEEMLLVDPVGEFKIEDIDRIEAYFTVQSTNTYPSCFLGWKTMFRQVRLLEIE